MKIAIIAAVANNNAIGIDNKIPWHLPEDLRYFKSITMGKPIIMGRRTFDSLGKPLPGRTNIIVTKERVNHHKNIMIATGIDEAIKIAEQVAIAQSAEEIMIIGGAHIYKQTLSLADKLYLTRIYKSFDADTFFPDIDTGQWHETFREEHFSKNSAVFKYAFTVLETV